MNNNNNKKKKWNYYNDKEYEKKKINISCSHYYYNIPTDKGIKQKRNNNKRI